MKTADVALKTVTLAIAGNPNSGKSTIFNRLTGLRQKVGNYAGVTVERKEGDYVGATLRARIIDLPGTYSLSPESEEQRIAAEVLLGRHAEVPHLDGVLLVIDSTCLERSLYLALQVIDTAVPVALILNMADEVALRGGAINATLLAQMLDVPVLSLSATKGDGVVELEKLIGAWKNQPPVAARSIPMIPLPTLAEVQTRRRQAKQLTQAVTQRALKAHPWSDKVDAVVMHKLWGPLIFLAVVLTVFQAIFSWAQPLMNLIDRFFTGLGAALHHAYPGHLATSFVADGVVAGVGSILIFLPQILIVFFFIALLENSGYLARAALVMDKLMSRMGLQGKSFLPLISSYACAIPGIMATRTIENKHDRLATIFVAPFMTCSARLPVYALLIGALVPDRRYLGGTIGLKALTLLGLYVLGFVAALITARLLKSSILKSDRTPFYLEIPPYRVPVWRTVGLLLWDRSRIFVQRAGTIILGVSVIMWALTSFPRHRGAVPDIRDSFSGRLGAVMEPVIRPLGFNWKIGVGLVSAQVAREVMVSTLATIYRVDTGAKKNTDSLQQALRKDMTPLSAVSLMVFFAFALQCTSTLAITRRETGSWKMPVAMFLYMNTLAYCMSLMIYQGGRWFGWS